MGGGGPEAAQARRRWRNASRCGGGAGGAVGRRGRPGAPWEGPPKLGLPAPAATGPTHAPGAAPQQLRPQAGPPSEAQVGQRCGAVAAAATETAAAPVWAHLQAALAALPPHVAPPRLRRLVVYGLGSLEQPGTAHIRYQLAAAQLLAAALPALAAPAEAFDPVFTALDRAVLARLGLQARRCGGGRLGLLGSSRAAQGWHARRRRAATGPANRPRPPPPRPSNQRRRWSATRAGGVWRRSPRCSGCRTARPH